MLLSEYFSFSLSANIPPVLLILILLLSEGQAGKAWQPSNKAMPCVVWEIIEQESTFLCALIG